MCDAGKRALPRRGPEARPVRSVYERLVPCVTYVNTLPYGDAASPQQLLDSYAAGHDLAVVSRYVDREGCAEPAKKPELNKALEQIRSGQAKVLLVVSEDMLSVIATERAAVRREVADAHGTLTSVGWSKFENKAPLPSATNGGTTPP
ncbi:recombinase family protein [Streptomyces sp. NPDC020883]|uniref:recombinase family protein n=1 Tax=Streptomyces sp. NPDC020883 TaxID=3365099 RepID=UPI00378A5AC4